MSGISARDWQTIVERLHVGQCVPFLGAGVNATSPTYRGLPLGAQVALEIARDLVAAADIGEFDELAKVEVLNDALKEYPQLLRLELQDLARVAFHLERAVDNPHVMQLVRRLLADEDREPSALLTTLAELPVPVIVTTNYDGLMEKALQKAGREYLTVVQPIGGFHPDDLIAQDAEVVEAVADERLVLYKIHGSFGANAGGPIDRIILTEEDYIEFLTVVANDEIGIPPKIRSTMATGTLLFLGYSLEDWDFRTIFKGTIERLQRYDIYKSFAIQRNPSAFWSKFWEQKKVVIYDMDLSEFAAQLQVKFAARRQRSE